MKNNVCSLFSGIGGIDLGFKQAGFDIVWANDIDEPAGQTYQTNFGAGSIVRCDIRDVDFKNVPDFDVLIAGFPCQSFSVCGSQKGFNDERGYLFFEIVRAADIKQPEVIFLENVANLVEHDKGKTFNIIHNELVGRNYIIRYMIADACDYGIPQHRTRTYIVAFKDHYRSDRFRFPDKQPLNKKIFDIIDKNVPVEEIFYLPKDSYQYKKMLPAIKDTEQIYRFSDYGIQTGKEGISFTLKANMGTWRDRVPCIKDSFGIRKITPEECLALMGFPKDFVFPNIPLKDKYRLCGNSVVVPLIYETAKNLRNCLFS